MDNRASSSTTSNSQDANIAEQLRLYFQKTKVTIQFNNCLVKFPTESARNEFIDFIGGNFLTDQHNNDLGKYAVINTPIIAQTPYALLLTPEQYNVLKEKYKKTVIHTPTATPFMIKSIRADERNFLRKFAEHLLPVEKKPHDLRPFPKKKFTVKATGVIERSKKQPEFTAEQKKGFSPIQSTSLVTDKVSPPVFFGLDASKKRKMVGVIIDRKDALFNRMFIYDNGTYGRPCDFDREVDASTYFNVKTGGTNPVLYANEDKFAAALTLPENLGKHNEVLARIRWNTDGTNKVFIGSETLEARLLAQDYARILLNQLRAYHKAHNLPLDPNYTVLICYYLPDNKKHLHPYDMFDQLEDIEQATRIYKYPEWRCAKYARKNYEFLLALDEQTIVEALCEDIPNESSVFNKIIKNGYLHIINSILEKIGAKAFTANTELKKLIMSDKNTLYSVLASAVQNGELDIIKSIIANKVDLNFACNNKPPLLCLAAEYLQSEIAELLIKHGTNIEKGNNEKLTPLMIAAKLGHTKMAGVLLAAKARVNQKDREDKTALFYAAQNGKTEVVRTLLKYGATTSTAGSGTTPLHAACSNGHADTAKLLLEHITIDQVDVADYKRIYETNMTPLICAVQNQHESVVKALVDGGVDVNTCWNNISPLAFATSTGNTTIARIFFAKKADVNARDPEKATPLHRAAQENKLDMVKLLVENGADIDARDGKGQTALHIATINPDATEIFAYLFGKQANMEIVTADCSSVLLLATRAGDTHILNTLLRFEAGIDMLDMPRNDGKTPLMMAIIGDHTKVANIILANKIGVTASDNEGKTALHHAISKPKPDFTLIKKLVECGGATDATDNTKTTPLLAAITHAHEDIAHYIFEHLVDKSTAKHANTEGKTPLHAAAAVGMNSMIEKLIRSIDEDIVNKPNNKGHTPLAYAARADKYESARLLISYGAEVTRYKIKAEVSSKIKIQGLINLVAYLETRSLDSKYKVPLIGNMSFFKDTWVPGFTFSAEEKLEAARVLYSAVITQDPKAIAALPDHAGPLSDKRLGKICADLGVDLTRKVAQILDKPSL